MSRVQISYSNYSIRTKPQLSAVEPSTQCTSARGGSHRNTTFGISHIENFLYNLSTLLQYIEIQVRLLSSSRPVLTAVLFFVHCYLILRVTLVLALLCDHLVLTNAGITALHISILHAGTPVDRSAFLMTSQQWRPHVVLQMFCCVNDLLPHSSSPYEYFAAVCYP